VKYKIICKARKTHYY